MQAGGGHLRQQDGHVLLLLPQPDQPLPDVGVHHAQRHLLLPAQRLVEVCEVSPDAGPRALRRPRDLQGGGQQALLPGDKHSGAQFWSGGALTCSVCAMPTPSSTICSPPSICCTIPTSFREYSDTSSVKVRIQCAMSRMEARIWFASVSRRACWE